MSLIRAPLSGLTGLTYEHLAYDRFGDWLDRPANYAFAYYASTIAIWIVLYIGETDDIRRRMSNHEVWPEAVQRGATHVLGHANWAGAEARKTEERDLIARYNPPLNVQHRVATSSVFGWTVCHWYGLWFARIWPLATKAWWNWIRRLVIAA